MAPNLIPMSKPTDLIDAPLMHPAKKAQHPPCPVGIILPRLDFPWKEQRPTVVPQLEDDVLDLRLWWKRFTVLLANALEQAGVHAEIYEWPVERITPAHVDRLGHKLVFVPHKCSFDFGQPRTAHVIFYMQEYFRWVFVVDSAGWSAGSSMYPFDLPSLHRKRKGIFKAYRENLRGGGLTSKFLQKAGKRHWNLRLSKEIPWGAYVFFPLQIPTDQAIRYFSDHSEENVVSAVIEWSQHSGVPIVFKPHPMNKKAMAAFEAQAKAAGCYWSTGNIHTLIEHSTAVFTINSGVGFEALFHLKPIVMFGRAEYDCVAAKVQDLSPAGIDAAWQASRGVSAPELNRRYRRFVDWFLTSYAVDLSSPNGRGRLGQIANMVKATLDAPAPTSSEDVPDLLLFITEKSAGWILHGICKEIDKHTSLKSCVYVAESGPDQWILPPAKRYFLAHYSFLPKILAANPDIKSSMIYSWYTHPSPQEFSEQELVEAFNSPNNQVFTTCSNFKNMLIEKGVHPARVSCILGGFDEKMFVPRPRQGRIVGMSTAFYERKAPDRILELIKLRPDLEFILLGKDWHKYGKYDELMSLPNLRYVETEYKNYPQYYAQMSVFVSPAILEGGPIPLIETMACNIVPVASQTGFAPDLIEDGVNGYLFPVDAGADAISVLIDKALINQYVVSDSVNDYTWANFAKAIEKVMLDSQLGALIEPH